MNKKSAPEASPREAPTPRYHRAKKVCVVSHFGEVAQSLAARYGVLSIAVIAFSLGFGLAWDLVVASKNATIETLSTASKEKDSKISSLQQEKDALQRENRELNEANKESKMPLQTRTMVLVNQLKELINRAPTNNYDYSAWAPIYSEYDARFENNWAPKLDHKWMKRDCTHNFWIW